MRDLALTISWAVLGGSRRKSSTASLTRLGPIQFSARMALPAGPGISCQPGA
jgi:hypothetical protein